MKYMIPLLLVCFSAAFVLAQPVQRGGIINQYAAVTGVDTCTGALLVNDTTGFQKNTEILLMQMQGASISTLNLPTYGVVTNVGNAGRWERNRVDSVAAGRVFVHHRLRHAYDWPGRVQIISVPSFSDLIITDTLKARPWNGSTGGVVALMVSGTLTLNAPVSANGAGFRGGAAFVAPINNCNPIGEASYVYAQGNWRGSLKGEGIAVMAAGREMGRGPQANGGGGGNDHNSGGGGGGNFATGGRGGNNNEPLIFGCNGFFPGLGGYGINQTPARLFMGGGGGAGHTNNIPVQSSGGHGGGVVWIEAGLIMGNNAIISANGTTFGSVEGDGGGGGGAGGTIVLKADAVSFNLSIQTQGGRGSNINVGGARRCFGPGGGGAGGRILTNVTAVFNTMGGTPGTIVASAAGCVGNTEGALAGGGGTVETLPPLPWQSEATWLPEIVRSPTAQAICPQDTILLKVLANVGNWTYQWQERTGNAWQNIVNTPVQQQTQTSQARLLPTHTAGSTRVFRCLVSRPGCGQRLSDTASISVAPAPKADFIVPDTITGCSGITAPFINRSRLAERYEWVFSGVTPGTSMDPNPSIAYTTSGRFRAKLTAFGSCPGSQDTLSRFFTTRLLQQPVSDFSFSVLSGNQVRFTPQTQHASELRWIFGDGSPVNTQNSPVHTYPQPGKYIVSLIAANGCGAAMMQKRLKL
jgi:PKD repeat protein